MIMKSFFFFNLVLQKAELVTKEKNRASAVAMNAEIRRTKARLSEEVPKLQRLAVKRVSFPFSSSFTLPMLLSSLAVVLVFGMILNNGRERENGGLVLGPDVEVDTNSRFVLSAYWWKSC